jgi:RimJ/RimL family protein N-acetyltransferase
VAAWWGAPLSLEGVAKEYGPSVDGGDPTLVYLVAEGARPVGLAQTYRMADHPDYARAVGLDDGAGVDLFIGQEDRCGHGLGPRIIAAMVDLAWQQYPEVSCALAGPSVRNVRSHRSFEKAGFTRWRQVAVPGEVEDEVIFVLPRPTPT